MDLYWTTDFYFDFWSIIESLIDFRLFGRLSTFPSTTTFWSILIDFHSLDCWSVDFTWPMAFGEVDRLLVDFWPVIRYLFGHRSFRSSLAGRLPKWPRLTSFDPESISDSSLCKKSKLFYKNFSRIGLGFHGCTISMIFTKGVLDLEIVKLGFQGNSSRISSFSSLSSCSDINSVFKV